MVRSTQIALFALTLILSGCVEPGYYPISHERCSATDPVHNLDANAGTIPGV
jgi:hypothetical protein